MNKQELADYCLKWRKSKGMTREVVAERSGMSTNTIFRIENGKNVSSGNLLKYFETIQINFKLK